MMEDRDDSNIDFDLDLEPNSNGKARKRHPRACDKCRLKKIKCDGTKDTTCSTCRDKGIVCTFTESNKPTGPPKGYVEQLERRIETMELLLSTLSGNGQINADGLMSSPSPSPAPPTPPPPQHQHHQQTQQHTQGTQTQFSPPSFLPSYSHPPSSDTSFSPALSSSDTEVNSMNKAFGSLTVEEGRFVGESSGVSYGRALSKLNSALSASPSATSDAPPIQPYITRQAPESYVDRLLRGNNSDALNKFRLPPEHVCQKLIKLYFKTAHITFPILHPPAFFRDYNERKHHFDPSFRALVFAVMALASRYSDDNMVSYHWNLVPSSMDNFNSPQPSQSQSQQPQPQPQPPNTAGGHPGGGMDSLFGGYNPTNTNNNDSSSSSSPSSSSPPSASSTSANNSNNNNNQNQNNNNNNNNRLSSKPPNGVAFFYGSIHLTSHHSSGASLFDIQSSLLTTTFLLGNATPTAAWAKLGNVILRAFDVGMHRQHNPIWTTHSAITDELRKRAWWAIYNLDRQLSATLGRPLWIHDSDIDVSLPLDITDEDLDKLDSLNLAYPRPWPINPATLATNKQQRQQTTATSTPASETPPVPPQQHHHQQTPLTEEQQQQSPPTTSGASANGTSSSSSSAYSLMSGFIATIRLSRIMGWAIMTIYSRNRDSVINTEKIPRWEERVLADLDQSLNSWLDNLPWHLRWSFEVTNNIHAIQSATNLCLYYSVQILIHRDFPSKELQKRLGFPSFKICTNSANSLSQTLHHLSKLNLIQYTWMTTPLQASSAAVVLLKNIYNNLKDPNIVESMLAAVNRCSEALGHLESNCYVAGSLRDEIDRLAQISDLQHHRVKRTHSKVDDDDEQGENMAAPSMTVPRQTKINRNPSHRSKAKQQQQRQQQQVQAQPNTPPTSNKSNSPTSINIHENQNLVSNHHNAALPAPLIAFPPHPSPLLTAPDPSSLDQNLQYTFAPTPGQPQSAPADMMYHHSPFSILGNPNFAQPFTDEPHPHPHPHPHFVDTSSSNASAHLPPERMFPNHTFIPIQDSDTNTNTNTANTGTVTPHGGVPDPNTPSNHNNSSNNSNNLENSNQHSNTTTAATTTNAARTNLGVDTSNLFTAGDNQITPTSATAPPNPTAAPSTVSTSTSPNNNNNNNNNNNTNNNSNRNSLYGGDNLEQNQQEQKETLAINNSHDPSSAVPSTASTAAVTAATVHANTNIPGFNHGHEQQNHDQSYVKPFSTTPLRTGSEDERQANLNYMLDEFTRQHMQNMQNPLI